LRNHDPLTDFSAILKRIGYAAHGLDGRPEAYLAALGTAL
jgi:hypothetical protein